jgi:hypothetical protein
MKPKKAWAILTTRGTMVATTGQCPSYQRRSLAIHERDNKFCDPTLRVVRVEVRTLPTFAVTYD